MGFASFLKVDLKQILRKISQWLIKSFDHYSTSFLLPNGQRLTVTPFDAYVILVVPFGGREIMESSRSSTDEEYDEVHATWVKEWKIEHATLELTPEFILAKKDSGKSFKRNFIIYLVNCFFSGPTNRYCSKSILKYVKDVNHIASLDWCNFVVQKLIISVRQYNESKSMKGVHFDGPLFFLMMLYLDRVVFI
ncbi:hypothetical protein Cgig2_009066 [Carnegiea gigantea]|uniref:Uncharacterized protein n=1 Tax=Carnegiea gigantea TaxID=171969 RepID=A0A9Q1JTN9_9CARY|nr:hypothetical protein Cgig2_009066 [Carnegiea gigantea]